MNRPPLSGIYLVLAAVSIISTFYGCDGALPVTKICRAASCVDLNCQNTSCLYGNCSPEGVCVCSACYTGASCDQLVNNHYPTFKKSRDYIIVSALLRANEHVTRMEAIDLDTTSTCHYDNDNCPCSQMLYSIESGNDDGLFAINERSGDVTVTRNVASDMGSVRKIYFSVVNQAVDSASGDVVGPKDFATLTVGIGSGSRESVMETNNVDDFDLPHDRQRRAAGSFVNNITFSLNRTGIIDSNNRMFVGSKVHFVMQVTFPVGITDLDVELFTPDNTTAVMVICNAQVTWIGNNILYTNLQMKPVLSGLDSSYNYNWAVLDFGNVTNTGALTDNINDTQIVIEWDVVMLDTAVNNTQYWVSAGAQYNNQNEIWIGQAGFNAFIDSYNSTFATPAFNISGPSSAVVGQTILFHVDMFLPNPVADVTFEAFAPINFTDSVSMCSLMVVDVGSGYSCVPFQTISYSTYQSANALTNERITMNLGHLINGASRDPTAPLTADVISVEFLVYIPVNATWVGQTVFIGAAVGLGTDQIWAGEIGVNITNITIPDVLSSPPVTTLNQSVNGTIYTPVLLEFNMTIANNTDTTYTVSVDVPATYRICSIALGFAGVNVPCLNSATPPVYGPTATTARWNLGRIRNAGQRSLSLDPTASTLQFIIYVTPLPTATGTASITVTHTYGATTTSRTANVVLVTSTFANSSSPVTTMTFNSGNGIVPVNASTDLRINIATFPGAVYTPVYLEITVPYGNNSNIYSICRVEVVSVGKFLPCVNMTALNASVQYFTMSNFSGAYKAVLQFDSLCNANLLSARNLGYVPGVNDSIVLSVIIRVENAVSLAANGSVNWVGAGLSYSPGILWLGSESLTSMQYPFLNYFNQTPFVNIRNPTPSNWSVVPAGTLTSFSVTLKLPPLSVADWRIRADAGSDVLLSVCNVFVKAYGRGIPCLNYSTPMRSQNRANGQGCQMAWLDLYKLTNVGTSTLYYDPIFDNNTVIVEVVVRVAASATVGSTRSVLITTDVGLNGPDNTSTLWFNVGAPPTGEFVNSTLPTVSLNLVPVNANDSLSSSVFKGETLIVAADLTIPTGSQHNINFTLVAPSGSVVDIVTMNVVLIGINLPCLVKSQFVSNLTTVYPGSYTQDMASMNLGTISSWRVDTSSPDSDKIRIEAIVTVVRNSSALAGTPIILNGLLTVNGTLVSTPTLTLNLIDTVDPVEYPSFASMSMADVQLNVSSTTPVQMFPADLFTLNFDVITPANSSVFSVVDVSLPVDGFSASMTVVSMTVVSFGVNVGSFESALEFPVVTNSTYRSTQMDRAYINLGKVINTGHTYRAEKYQFGDDNIRIQVVLQMADALINTRDSNRTVSVGARLGMPMVFRNLLVQVRRALNEVPDLIVLPALNSTSTTPTLLNIDVIVKHSNVSRAETYNTSLLVYLSNYAVFSAVSTNYTGPYPRVTNMTANNGVSITFSSIYFTDIIQLTIQLLVLPAKGNSSQVLTFASMETVYSIIFRTSATNPAGFVFITPLVNVNYTVTPLYQAACVGGALGMQGRAILDCQLSASYSPTPGYQAVNARYGDSAGWVGASRAGSHDRYYQVNFGNLTMVSDIELQTVSGSYSAVTQYRVQYSNDGINWIDGEIVNTNGNRKDTLLSPVESVYLRVKILAPAMNQANAAFRIELYGCVTGLMPAAPSAQCLSRQGYVKPTTSLPAWTPRNFIVTSTNVFYCDTDLRGTTSCFRSTDLTPTSWQSVDSRVVNVLGFLSTTTPGQLFGIDASQRVIVISEDAGLTWMSLSPQRYTSAAVQIANKAVPWIWDSTNLPTGTTVGSLYSYGSWGANFDGIMIGTSLAADWKNIAQT